MQMVDPLSRATYGNSSNSRDESEAGTGERRAQRDEAREHGTTGPGADHEPSLDHEPSPSQGADREPSPSQGADRGPTSAHDARDPDATREEARTTAEKGRATKGDVRERGDEETTER